MIENIQPVEWMLLTFTLVGLTTNVIRLVKVIKEQERIRTERVNGLYGFTVKMHVIDEWLRIVKHIFLMTATIYFMLASMERIGPMLPEARIGRLFLCGLSALLAVKSQVNDWG